MSSKKAPAKKETPVKGKRKVSIQTLLLGFLTFGLALQFFQVSSLQKKVQELSPGAEEGSALSDIFGLDEETEEDKLSTLLFDFVNNLGAYEENKARYEGNLAALQTGMQQDFWSPSLLSLQNPEGTYTEDGLEYIFSETPDSLYPGHPIITLSLGYDGILSVDTYGFDLSLSDKTSVETSLSDLKTYIEGSLSALRETVQKVNGARGEFTAFITGPDFQAVLTGKGLTALPEVEQDASYLYAFQNVDAAAVAECKILKVDASVACSSLSPQAEVTGTLLSELQGEILVLFTEVDARSVLQKKVDEQKAMISGVLEDPAFKAALGNVNLSVGAPTESDTAIEYPIVNTAGTVLRLLILDKATGEVKVSLPDGQETQSLAAAVQLLEFSSKKKLWTSPVSSQTMLS